ncbi:hypothetical protein QFC22_004241 [Naganishia vaughanmartiniae]|uniref:Uncharacterized protein n=1 Tax=Naganishia vaughanmartiniae TaxID=1424756 RepID=A0ACC2X2S5_9TREE|nr:hypothetical protein QFC22_004241 [Naganishia vaughanmartiniae]
MFIFPPAPSLEAALTADEWISGKTSAPKVIDLETRSTTIYESAISSAPPAAATAPEPVKKEEPKPAVKQSSVTEKTGKLPDMRDLEIKQDDPDSDEEITEAKKRAPSTGGFDDDEEEVADKKSVEKSMGEPAEKPVEKSTEESAASVETDNAKPEEPTATTFAEVSPVTGSSSFPSSEDNADNTKEVSTWKRFTCSCQSGTDVPLR